MENLYTTHNIKKKNDKYFRVVIPLHLYRNLVTYWTFINHHASHVSEPNISLSFNKFIIYRYNNYCG